jgi:hypothetical protein
MVGKPSRLRVTAVVGALIVMGRRGDGHARRRPARAALVEAAEGPFAR